MGVRGAPITVSPTSPRGQLNWDMFYTSENKGYFCRAPALFLPIPRAPQCWCHTAGSVPISHSVPKPGSVPTSRRVPTVPRVPHKGPSVLPGHHVRLSHAAAANPREGGLSRGD